jgi:glycosyltransferase involved in cell wall biosynthesis
MPELLKSKLQQADYLIQTSHYETFSTVVAESLACGVPVISTPVGIFPEIFGHGIGILIQSAEPDEIAKSIAIAIKSRGSHNNKAMTEIATKLFSNESVGEALFAIYTDVLVKQKQ